MKPQKPTPKKDKKLRWENAFLSSYAKTGIVQDSCRRAKVDRSSYYKHVRNSPRFAELVKSAHESAMDRLEREANRRAVRGLLRKKFTSKGEPLIDPATGEQYAEREYSDTLLIFLLKGGRPEKFRERMDVNQSGSVRLEIVEEIVDADSSQDNSTSRGPA